MKMAVRKLLTLVSGSLILVATIGYSVTSSAQEKKHGRRGFRRGVCVGQTLAQQGIILPPHVPGQKATRDPATQAAFEAAVQSCNVQYQKPAPTSS